MEMEVPLMQATPLMPAFIGPIDLPFAVLLVKILLMTLMLWLDRSPKVQNCTVGSRIVTEDTLYECNISMCPLKEIAPPQLRLGEFLKKLLWIKTKLWLPIIFNAPPLLCSAVLFSDGWRPNYCYQKQTLLQLCCWWNYSGLWRLSYYYQLHTRLLLHCLELVHVHISVLLNWG